MPNFGKLSYGNTTVLELGGGKSYLLESFSFTFTQPVDIKGKAQQEVIAGAMEMTYDNLPSSEISKWMLNTRNYRDGHVKIYGEDGSLVQEIAFEKATCVSMDIRYIQSGSGYCMTHLIVQARSITVDHITVENTWQNI